MNNKSADQPAHPQSLISTFVVRCQDSIIGLIGYFVPRSFRTQIISYHFGHFVPTFIFNMVISYPIWSFRTHFVPSLVISYLLLLFSRQLFWLFRTFFFNCFVPKSFRTRSHFVPILVIPYPDHFVPTSKLGTNWLSFLLWFATSRLGTNWLWYETTFFFSVAIIYGGSVYHSLGVRWKGITTFW